jgi:hypothetical protein
MVKALFNLPYLQPSNFITEFGSQRLLGEVGSRNWLPGFDLGVVPEAESC